MKYIPYSQSRIDCFEQCKLKFKYHYIDKIETENNQKFFHKGHFLHELIENYFQDLPINKQAFSANYKDLLEEKDIEEYFETFNKFTNYKQIKIYKFKEEQKGIEEAFFLDNKMCPIDTEENAWFDGKIDFYLLDKENKVGLIVDWKSGNFYENKDTSQLELYAIYLIQKYDLLGVKCKFFFIEHDKTIDIVIKKEDLPELKKKFLRRIGHIERENEFMSNISKNCKYCSYASICEDFA